jgi:hypothetical protein
MALICCVCETEIALDTAEWPNAWERSRKRFACCNSDCATQFNADKHWGPSRAPTAASHDDTNRLISVLRTRLRDGDSPSVVTRELLQAGIASDLIRGILLGSQAAGDNSRRQARNRTIFGFVRSLFTGTWSISVSRDKRVPSTFEPAFDDLEHWQRAMELRNAD